MTSLNTATNHSTMGTREITINFMPLRNKSVPEWSYKHTVPANLVAPAHVQNSQAYVDQFRREVSAIVPKYQAECDAKAGNTCTNCGGRAYTAVLTPCSYLHKTEDPLINILLHPICGLPQCRSATGKLIEETMSNVDEITSETKCEVCGRMDGIKRCAKCKLVGYCGIDCQKKHWKQHKKDCSRLAEMREAEERSEAARQAQS